MSPEQQGSGEHGMKHDRLIELLTIAAIVSVGAVGQWWLATLLIGALSGA